MEKILKEIDVLPTLDTTILKIQKFTMDPNSTIKELSDVISKDNILTVNILKATNSPLYGFSKEIKSIHQAVSLFGISSIRGFAMNSFVKRTLKMDLSPYGITNEDFSNLSLKQAGFINVWCKNEVKDIKEILLITSFIIEIGKIITSKIINDNNKTDEFNEQLKNCENFKDIFTLEKKYCKLSSEEISSKIFEKWNLEKTIINSIKYSVNTEDCEDELTKTIAEKLYIIKELLNVNSLDSEQNYNNALIKVKEFGYLEDTFINAYENFKN